MKTSLKMGRKRLCIPGAWKWPTWFMATLKGGNYEAALKDIAGLRPAVDLFFDEVMVMVDNAAVRQNRMGLLSQVAALFRNIADFTLL